jgi:transketolase
MRNAFLRTLAEVAAADPRVWLLTGDLGFGALEGYAAAFPERTLNMGIAEQNMIGTATGLALSGKTVFVYSIANFPTLRCLEQIRNDACLHRAPVKIVALGGGVVYGTQGYTHHAVEDLAILGALPGLTLVAPGDPAEVAALVPQIVADPGPVYLRLGRAGDPMVHAGAAPAVLGRLLPVRAGDDLAVLALGNMLEPAVRLAEALSERTVTAAVFSVHTPVPLDRAAVLAAARHCGAVLTLEEHASSGGLGTRVAELLMAERCYVPLARIGLVHTGHPTGSQAWYRRGMGDLTAAAESLLQEKRGQGRCASF